MQDRAGMERMKDSSGAGAAMITFVATAFENQGFEIIIVACCYKSKIPC